MNRRDTVLAMLALGAAPLAAEAQQAGKVYRIGTLGNLRTDTMALPLWEAFRQGLRDHGWVEGQNMLIESRWAEGKFDRFPELAAELVRLNVDLIFAPSSIYVEAARKATLKIPIVFANHADPVGSGHVASLRRPGGNITGLATLQTQISGKGAQLLKEAVPGATRFAVLWNPATPSNSPGLKAVEAAGPLLGVRIQSLAVRTPEDLEGAFSAMQRERADALVVISAVIFFAARDRLAALALKNRLPSIFAATQHADAGGLLAYGANNADLFRRSAGYVDKILKGANPAELAVEQASKFEFAINLKTAKALGITIPQSVLLRADKVIE